MDEQPTGTLAAGRRRQCWVGAVLTGGSSRRMGRDKASLLVDGTAMAARVGAALHAAGAAQVVCVGPAVGGLAAVVEDEPGSGPLGAVIGALRWADGRAVVVAACDLIAPDASAFAAVAAALQEGGGAHAAVPVVGGRAQPLAAAYAPSALSALTAAHARGERSITDALRALRTVAVDGIDPSALADADVPGDLPS